MPSKDSHLRIVHENTAAINWVRQAQPSMPQWVVTIAFHKALHIIEAVFAADKFGLETDEPVLNTDPDKVDLAGNVSTKHQKSNINQV